MGPFIGNVLKPKVTALDHVTVQDIVSAVDSDDSLFEEYDGEKVVNVHVAECIAVSLLEIHAPRWTSWDEAETDAIKSMVITYAESVKAAVQLPDYDPGEHQADHDRTEAAALLS